MPLTAEQLIQRLADAYWSSGLDEARPEWHAKGLEGDPMVTETILISGRGGRTLLTLSEVLKAAKDTRDQPHKNPQEDRS